MSELQNNDSFQENYNGESVASYRINGLSTNEIMSRTFREPFFHFLLFMGALWRNAFWIVPSSVILAACLGGLYFMTSTEKYTSRAWIRIFNEPRYIAFPRQYSREETAAMVQANLQFIYSPPVLNNAWTSIMEKSNAEGIDISYIMELREPTEWLSNNIHVQRRGESPIYIFSFTTENSRLSQLILESLMTSYFSFISQSNKSNESSQRESLLESANVKRKDIEDLHTQYLRIVNQITEAGGEIPSDMSRLITSQPSLSIQIIETESQIRSQEILLALNQKMIADGPEITDGEVEADVYTNPIMVQLLAERVQLLDDRERRLLRDESEDTQGMLKNQRQLDDLEKRIQNTAERLAQEAKQRRKAEGQEMARKKITESEQLIEQLKSRVVSLREANRDQQSKEGNRSKLITEALEVQAMKNREEQVYNILMQQLGVLNTESAAPEQVDLISKADFPAFADTGSRNRMTMLLCLFGFLVPIMIAWGREVLSPRFYHSSQFPILFPHVAMEAIADVPLPGYEHHMSERQKLAYYQSIDETCCNFCFGPAFRGTGVFLFSSVVNDDGQAQLALSIAEKIAQMKKKPVLLIDTHGENPILRQLFGVKDNGSLSDVLSIQQSLNDAIVSDSQQQNLYFLPDGPSPGHSMIDQFSDGRFEMLLNELKKHYPTIIISTAPIQESPTSQLLCHYADSVVLSLRIFETLRKETEVTCERLANIGTPVNAFMVAGIAGKK